MFLSVRPKYLAALTLVIGVFLASHAFAGAPSEPPKPVKEGSSAVANGGYADSWSNADADSHSFSNATSQAAGGSVGDVNASANSEGSSANNSFAYTNREIRQAPSVFAPAVYASGPCSIGGSLGLSGPGFGVSGGKSRVDADCNLREMIRVLTPLNPALALALACTDPLVAKVAGAEGCKLPPAPEPQKPCAACESITKVYEDKIRELAREEASVVATKAFRASQSK